MPTTIGCLLAFSGDLYYTVKFADPCFKDHTFFFQTETNSLNYKAKLSRKMLSISIVLVKGRADRRQGSSGIGKERSEKGAAIQRSKEFTGPFP